MLFNSSEFILYFLPVVLAVFILLNRPATAQANLVWLTVSSLFFYSWWNPSLLALLLASILFNYSIGKELTKPQTKQSYPILVFGVTLNLATLGYYKYAYFAADNINQIFGVNITLDPIALPLAISFFTFQQITYLVDSYRNETHEHDFIHYVSMCPSSPS